MKNEKTNAKKVMPKTKVILATNYKLKFENAEKENKALKNYKLKFEKLEKVNQALINKQYSELDILGEILIDIASPSIQNKLVDPTKSDKGTYYQNFSITARNGEDYDIDIDMLDRLNERLKSLAKDMLESSFKKVSKEDSFFNKLQECFKYHIEEIKDPEQPEFTAIELFKFKCDSIDKINYLILKVASNEVLTEGEKKQLTYSFLHVLEIKEIIRNTISIAESVDLNK